MTNIKSELAAFAGDSSSYEALEAAQNVQLALTALLELTRDPEEIKAASFLILRVNDAILSLLPKEKQK